MVGTNLTAQAIDDVLAGTFPASDPPGWTPGIARPAPPRTVQAADTGSPEAEATKVRASGVIDVSRATDSARTFGRAIVSLIGAVGLVLLVPVAILAVGTPVALGVRGVLEAAERLLAIIR